MRELKVTKFENAFGVVLPLDVVDRMKVEEGSSIFLVETSEGTFELTTQNPDFDAKLEKAKEIMSRYPNTLRTLAQ